MDVASYYPRVPNECFIQRTTATFIRKSIGHIGELFKKKMYLTTQLQLCRRPLYAYINWCGSVLNRLFYQQPISICTICTIKTVCILLSIACTVNFLKWMIPDSKDLSACLIECGLKSSLQTKSWKKHQRHQLQKKVNKLSYIFQKTQQRLFTCQSHE